MILTVKNIISLFNFYLLKLFFGRKNNPQNKNILFYNSEKIGDLIVSSVIMEYDDLIYPDSEIYFLIKGKYAPLFSGYRGRIKIIKYKYGLYKWFLPYRIILIKRLRKFELDKLYNLTPARGMLNDEISLLSGANKIYAINKNNKYLKGTGNITEKLYDDILFEGKINEYLKHIDLLKTFGIEEKNISFENKKTFKIKENNFLIYKNEVKKDGYIVIAPLSTEPDRAWGIDNFKKLCRELSNEYKIVLEGSQKEIKLLSYIKGGNQNIIIDTSPLEDLHGIIMHCKLFIGGDSGLTHIALKLGKPMLAVLDGGYFNRYFPFRTDDKNNNYIYKMMDCFECGFDCIYDKKLCLTGIRYDDVLKKVKEILNKVD